MQNVESSHAIIICGNLCTGKYRTSRTRPHGMLCGTGLPAHSVLPTEHTQYGRTLLAHPCQAWDDITHGWYLWKDVETCNAAIMWKVSWRDVCTATPQRLNLKPATPLSLKPHSKLACWLSYSRILQNVPT